MARSTAFRRFVFSRYASRLTQLMGVLEDVAFERVDRRLARKLLEISAGGTTLDVTHQSLAVELGSAREVITRQIKDFASKGWLTSTRGRIEILDRQALTELARRP